MFYGKGTIGEYVLWEGDYREYVPWEGHNRKYVLRNTRGGGRFKVCYEQILSLCYLWTQVYNSYHTLHWAGLYSRGRGGGGGGGGGWVAFCHSFHLHF